MFPNVDLSDSIGQVLHMKVRTTVASKISKHDQCVLAYWLSIVYNNNKREVTVSEAVGL